MKKALIAAMLAFLIMAPAAAAAEISSGEILPAEREAIAHLSRGRDAEALASYRQALSEAVAKGSRVEAEALLERVIALTGALDAYKETLEFMQGVPQDGMAPVLRGFWMWEQADLCLHAGEIGRAAALLDGMGFVTDWRVIGPFQNEKGTGFDNAFEPEKEFDLAAKYEGKVRQVSWRKVPCKAMLKSIDLDAMLRPNDECLAYAIAFVRMSADAEAAVRIGSDEGFKLWVNGALVINRDIHRTLGFDQDAAGARLRKGWNRILIKVAERDGGWGFRLRLTKPDGSPLAVEAVAAADDEFQKASSECPDAKPESEVIVKNGAWGWYTSDFVKNSKDPWVKYHASILIRARGALDEDDLMAKNLMESAVALDNANADLQYEFSRALIRAVKMEAEKEENQKRAALLAAVAADENHFPSIMALSLYYKNELRNIERAREYSARALKVNPDNLDALMLEADLLEEKGFSLEGKLRMRRFAADARHREDSRLVWFRIGEANSADNAAEVERLYRHLLGRDRIDFRVRGALVNFLESRGREQEVVALWEEEHKLLPFDTDYCMRMSNFALGRDDMDCAAKWIKAAIEIVPDEERLHQQLGDLYRQTALVKGDAALADEAMKCYEKALVLNPANPTLKKYVEFLSADKKSFEEDEQFAEDFDALVKDAPEKTDDPNDPAYFIFKNDIVKINRDGSAHQYTHEIIRILNEAGAKEYESYGARRMSYGASDLKMKKARVVHPDGTEEPARMGSGWVRFTTLQIGDTIEIEYRFDPIKEEDKFFGDYYGNIFQFQDDIYWHKRKFTLILPKDRKFYFSFRNVPEKPAFESEDKLIRTWVVEKVKKITPESAMPGWLEILPQIRVSSFGTWTDLGKWYWGLVKKQFDVSPEMKAKVQELTKDCKTDFEKIQAIYNFVVTEIKYEQWEFGIHGYKPYKTSAIFKRGFGDCKDKAFLINTMLGEVGIQGYPVLIGADNRRDEEPMDLPMFLYFNHCISYVVFDGGKNSMFLDGTASYHNAREIPSMDMGARVLVITQEGGRIERIPWPTLEQNFGVARYDIAVMGNGSAIVDGTVEPKGSVIWDAVRFNAPYARENLHVEGQRTEKIEEVYNPVMAGAKADEKFIKVSDLKNLNEPVTYSFRLTVPKIIKETPSGWELPNTFFPLKLNEITSKEKRDFDMVLFPPSAKEESITYKLPPGYAVKSKPEPSRIESKFGKMTLEYEATPEGITVKKRIEIAVQRISKEDYPAFREFVNSIDVEEKKCIVIIKKEGAE